MFAKVFDALFGCTHANYGFPRSIRSGCNGAAGSTRTYVVCFDCGKELAYDWERMHVVKPQPPHSGTSFPRATWLSSALSSGKD